MNESRNITLQIDPRWEQQVNQQRLREAVHQVLQVEGVNLPAELSLVIVGDEEIQELNQSFRKEASTTDVLSFPYTADGVDEEMEGYLGDVIVSYEQAARQAREEGHDVEEELSLLTVHGTLHLLGYDDEAPDEKARMWDKQRQVLERLDLTHIAPR